MIQIKKQNKHDEGSVADYKEYLYTKKKLMDEMLSAGLDAEDAEDISEEIAWSNYSK